MFRKATGRELSEAEVSDVRKTFIQRLTLDHDSGERDPDALKRAAVRSARPKNWAPRLKTERAYGPLINASVTLATLQSGVADLVLAYRDAPSSETNWPPSRPGGRR